MATASTVLAPSCRRAPASGDAMVHLIAVSRSFALDHTIVHALRQVTLAIGRGEMVALWGPSGSGKSTLLNLVGLVDAPGTGEVVFDGQDVSRLSDDERSYCRNHKIGFVFQNFNLVPVMDTLENVMLPLQLAGRGERAARSRALALLDAVGLAALAGIRPDRLSGGQRQRVAIARALAVEPMLVIADEPTANLDSENSHAIIDLMHRMNRDTGATFIFSTHDQRLLDRVPRHLCIQDGRIVADQPGGFPA